MSENKYDAQHACNYDELLKENARLKELNREMVEALEMVVKEYLEDIVYRSLSYDTYMQASIALTRAKEEEGE